MNFRQAYFLLLFALIFSCVTSSPPLHSSKRSLAVVYAQRTDTLYKRCPTLRTTFSSSQVNESQSWARKQTASSINWNGDALIYDLLTNDTNGAQKQVNASLANSIIYVIFMAIGLVIMIVFAPIMICCCCNPEGCPPSQCCRNAPNRSYTKCERTWPALVLIFLSLIAMAAAIAIFIVNPELQKSYSQTRCSISIFFDDLINGNYTKDNSQYFIGLKPLKANLSLTSPALTSSSSGNQTLDNILGQVEAAQEQVGKLANEDKSPLDLSYVSPLNTSPSTISVETATVPSTLPQTLSDLQQSLSGLLFAIRGFLSAYQNPSKLSSSVSQVLPSPLQKYAKLTTYVEDMDKNTEKKLQQIQDLYLTPIIIVIYVIAGIVALFSLFLLLSVICLCCCQKYGCRKFMYLICAVLTLMGILFFVLSIVMSATTVGSHYGCNYIDGGLQTKAEFVYRFSPIFQNQVLTQLVAQCAARENTGIVVSSTLKSSAPNHNSSVTLSSTLSDLLSVSENTTSTLASHLNSEILDIASENDIRILQKLSDSTLYSCSASGFSRDSWVPSIHQQTVYVPCRSASMEKVSSQTCTSSDLFQSSASGCHGCIDSSAILGMYSNHEQVLAALNSRYPADSCKLFNEELSNTWHNFYLKKQEVIPPIIARSASLTSTINSIIDLSSQLSPLPQSTQVSSASSTSSSATSSSATSSSTNSSIPPNPLSAVVTQLRCKVLGEDIDLIVNTFCTQFFNYSFIMRILTIIISFCLLLVLFCSTCLGMRAYHSEKYSKRTDQYEINQENVGSEHAMNGNMSDNFHPGYYSNHNYSGKY